jgi:hypothetical protein
MKIEIAESIIYSYLKHIEGCRIVQTNWKTSGKWIITEFEQEKAKLLFDRISQSETFSGIFKKNSFEQLIKQAEIDVLGINTAENTVYGIDVAFHSNGVNYGNKKVNALNILKKIFRAIFIMQTFFPENQKINSYFITPKVNPASKVLIDGLIIKARDLINDENITIELISNEEFYSRIADPLIEQTDDENDTSELFLRAVKLTKLDNRIKKTNPNIISKHKKSGIVDINKRTINGMKIGQFVKYSINKAYEQNLISSSEIRNLTSIKYSKEVFNLNTEVLRDISKPIRDEKGNNRYYSKDVFCGNYHLSSQWIESQWDLFINWLNKIGYDYKNIVP